MTLDELIVAYSQEYGKQKHPFLLFDLAGNSENAHTRVLHAILTMDSYRFLPSFLEMAGLPKCDPNGVLEINAQKPAISPGLKSAGFMDIYLEYKSARKVQKVIIENKINGAGDTKDQLNRYIATSQGVDNNGFEAWKKKGKVKDKERVRVLYLTEDGGKTVNMKQSLEEKIMEQITFIPINYADDLYPWIKGKVLPNLTWTDEGLVVAGILQYVASLESQLYKAQVSNMVRQYVGGLDSQPTKRYTTILKDVEELSSERYSEEPWIPALKKELEFASKWLFDGDLPGWKIYVTPSFYVLYKPEWAILDDGAKKNYPSVHISGTTESLIKKKGLKGIHFVVENTDRQAVGVKYARNTAIFRDRDAAIDVDADVRTSRETAWRELVEKESVLIKVIDEFVEDWKKNPRETNPFSELVDLMVKLRG